ncbi:hypothetical protein Dimus_015794 [Dionaea muscipula]
MQVVKLRSNVKAWKVKYMYVTSDEWDFGEEIAEVLKEPTPKPRAVLNEVLIFWKKLRPKGGHRINNSNNSSKSNNRQLLAQVGLLDKQAHHLKDQGWCPWLRYNVV